MKHRIAAGALVVKNDQLLMVHHLQTGTYDFWIASGGGVSGSEALAGAAERENLQLNRANEILRKASAFFAQAELDRRRK